MPMRLAANVVTSVASATQLYVIDPVAIIRVAVALSTLTIPYLFGVDHLVLLIP